MFYLIMKDLRIQKRSFLFAFLYTFFIIFVFRKPDFSESLYIMMSIIIGYIFAFSAIGYDEKNNSDIFLLSLPIKKHSIVIAKYLSVFVFSIIGITISGSIGVIINISGFLPEFRFINFIDIITSFITMGFLMSLYYPFYFKFGSINIKLLNICFFMIFFFAPSSIVKFLVSNKDNPLLQDMVQIITNISPSIFGLLMMCIVIIIMIISSLISVRIYQNKDF